MSVPVVWTGALSPESIQIVVSQGTSGVDLTTVSAATISTKRGDGTVVTWSATLSAQTTTSVTVTHAFVAGDTAPLGNYVSVAKMTVPSGTLRSQPVQFNVVDQYSNTAN